MSTNIKKLEDIIESEDVFETVRQIEGFDTLNQEELIIIKNGMNKVNYRKMDLVRNRAELPRWIDLERLVKQVIEFKKTYPGWILERIAANGQYDSLPPQTFYKFTYKTPHGHYMSFGGIEVL